MCALDQLAETADDVGLIAAADAKGFLILAQQGQDAPFQLSAALNHPAAKAQPDHRIAP